MTSKISGVKWTSVRTVTYMITDTGDEYAVSVVTAQLPILPPKPRSKKK